MKTYKIVKQISISSKKIKKTGGVATKTCL